jgi:hypothetical protein
MAGSQNGSAEPGTTVRSTAIRARSLSSPKLSALGRGDGARNSLPRKGTAGEFHGSACEEMVTWARPGVLRMV